MLAVLAVGSLEHTRAHRTFYAAFLGANALVVAWAIVRFVGVRESVSDLRWGLRFRHARERPITTSRRMVRTEGPSGASARQIPIVRR